MITWLQNGRLVEIDILGCHDILIFLTVLHVSSPRGIGVLLELTGVLVMLFWCYSAHQFVLLPFVHVACWVDFS